MAYKMRNPYPKMGTVATSRKGKINPKSDSNLEDGREKSSAFQKSSPLHGKKYVAKQLVKAKKLEERAKKQEEKAEETRAYTKEKYGEESLFFFHPSGKRARTRAKKAKEKAAAGSRKAYRESKKENKG